MVNARYDGKVDPDPYERAFVNSLLLSFGISQVDMKFSQRGDIVSTLRPNLLLTTTPTHFVSFSRAFSDAIDQYERQFGKIPLTPDPQRQQGGR